MLHSPTPSKLPLPANASSQSGIGSERDTLFRTTPLLSLSKDGAACTLIEIGDVRILLDCGLVEPPVYNNDSSSKLSTSAKSSISSSSSSDIASAGGGGDNEEARRNPWLNFTRNDFYKSLKVDVILISHADKQHMGALPLVIAANSGANSESSHFSMGGDTGNSMNLTSNGRGPLLLCTLPVCKFGHLLLYDLYLNRAMENSDESKTFNIYSLDDIDRAFVNAYAFKFQETRTFKSSRLKSPISFCPLRAGRTIGGAIWHVTYQTTDICYGSDFFELSDKVVEEIATGFVPKSSILIAEPGVKDTAIGKSRTSDEKSKKLINDCKETLRSNGNVLIPCETSGRVLELLCAFNEYWNKKENLGLRQYKIVFLSHMARSMHSRAKSCTEWYNIHHEIAKKFFDGKGNNPFELNNINFCCSVLEMAELDKGSSGSSCKIVFATDSTLNYGLSKEVFLRWAENPLTRIIFVDSSPQNSVADMIRNRANQTKSVTGTSYSIMLPCPEKVALEGTELDDYLRDKQRLQDEEELRKKEASSELQVDSDSDDDAANAAVAQVVSDDKDASVSGSSMQIGSSSNNSNNNNSNNSSNNLKLMTPLKDDVSSEIADVAGGKRLALSQTPRSLGQHSASKRSKMAHALSKALEGSVIMFQNKEETYVTSEYGIGNEDLTFKNIDQVYKRDTTSLKAQTFIRSFASQNNQSSGAEEMPLDEVHYKTVTTWRKIDIYCDVKDEVSLGNHADTKSLKDVIRDIAPSRVILLSSTDAEASFVQSYCKNHPLTLTRAYINRETVLSLAPDKIKLLIPHNQMSQLQITLKDRSNANEELSSVSVYELKGCLEEFKDGASANAGVRTFLLKPPDTEKEIARLLELGKIEGDTVDSSDQLIMHGDSSNLGMVALSLGQMSFIELRDKIVSEGINVETKYNRTEAIWFILCDSQVVIKCSDRENGFEIEGPPSLLYDKIRSIVYEKFAFL